MKRRTLLLSLAPALTGMPGQAQTPAQAKPLAKRIPSSGEEIPAIGLGSWITFNVGNDPRARAQCAEVVRAFFADGGRLIDSSPMYGSSQPVIGQALASLGTELQRNSDPDALVTGHVAVLGLGTASEELMMEAKACADAASVIAFSSETSSGGSTPSRSSQPAVASAARSSHVFRIFMIRVPR